MANRKSYRCELADFGDLVERIAADETGELERLAAREIVSAAEGCRDDLESRARTLFGGTGTYASGMAVSSNEHGADTSAVVYNAGPDASLGHLLENGHQIVVNVGGRGPKKMMATGRRTQARPHWRPAFEDAVSELDRRLRHEV